MLGAEEGEFMFNGYRVLVWEDEKVLEMAGGAGSTAMGIYLMPGNGPLIYLHFACSLPL